MSSESPSQPIYNLYKSGELTKLHKLGVLKPSILLYCKLYEKYLQHRSSGKNYLEACEATADEMNTSADTVRRAVGSVV